MPKRVASPALPLNITTEFNHWMTGVGGECSRYDPPAGPLCNPNFTGGGFNWDGPGPFFPTGIELGSAAKQFPQSPKWGNDTSQAVFTSWTNGWYTSHFDVASWDGTKLVFGPLGGTQGGRGWHFDASLSGPPKICTGNVRASDCGPVKIEGLLAELDAPSEYHFRNLSNARANTTATAAAAAAAELFLFYNVTDGTPPPAHRMLVVPALQQLVRIRGDFAGGDPAVAGPRTPVSNVSILNIKFRDAAPTFLEPHGVPSGGDWSLQRTAAVLLEGTQGVVLDRCTFKYLGGIAYQVSGWNRGSVVNRSEFAFLGGSAATAWGYTASTDPEIPAGVGIDGTNGNQPHGAVMMQSVCREIGLQERQSSCWFQAKTALSRIESNVFYNGPRCAASHSPCRSRSVWTNPAVPPPRPVASLHPGPARPVRPLSPVPCCPHVHADRIN